MTPAVGWGSSYYCARQARAVFLGQNHYDITPIQISDVYIDCPY